LAKFRSLYLGASELASRTSELFWLDVYTWQTVFGISAGDVLDSIRDLEDGELKSIVKPATQFMKPPLKGLWHKHVFSARFIPKNISSALGKHGVRKIVTDVVGTDGSLFTLEKAADLADRLINQSFEKRATANALTGEWIIYLQYKAKNYYLCCGVHNDEDQYIYDRIVEHCVRDFPWLSAWLKSSTEFMK